MFFFAFSHEAKPPDPGIAALAIFSGDRGKGNKGLHPEDQRNITRLSFYELVYADLYLLVTSTASTWYSAKS
jgi:hypothetical protein